MIIYKEMILLTTRTLTYGLNVVVTSQACSLKLLSVRLLAVGAFEQYPRIPERNSAGHNL